MEAMATETPVLASDTGAIPELLDGGRGYKFPLEYEFRDVWGNAWRGMVDIEKGAKLLRKLMDEDMTSTVKRAKEYVSTRTWDIPVKQLDEKIQEITNG